MFMCILAAFGSTLQLAISCRLNSASASAATAVLTRFLLLCVVNSFVDSRPVAKHAVRQVPLPSAGPLPPSAAGDAPAMASVAAQPLPPSQPQPQPQPQPQSVADVDLSSLGLLGPQQAIPPELFPAVPGPVGAGGFNMAPAADGVTVDAPPIRLASSTANSTAWQWKTADMDSSTTIIATISIALLVVIVGVIIGVAVARKKQKANKAMHGASKSKSKGSKGQSSAGAAGHSKSSKVNEARHMDTKSEIAMTPSEKEFEKRFGHRRWQSERERDGALKAFKMTRGVAHSRASTEHKDDKPRRHDNENHETTSLLTKASH